MIDPDKLIYSILEEEGGIVKKTLKGAGKVLGTAAGVAGGMAAHKEYQDYQTRKHWEEIGKSLEDAFKLN